MAERLEIVRAALDDGPTSPYDCALALAGTPEPDPALLNWAMTEGLCYLAHLEAREVVRREDGGSVGSWRLA